MIAVYAGKVAADFVDYNNHMNDAAYALVFSRAADGFFALAGIDAASRASTGLTIYTLAMMIRYQREALLGEALHVGARILEHDARRVRLWLEMARGESGVALASCEQVLICVRQSETGAKAASFAPGVAAWLDATGHLQASLAWPAEAGNGIALKPRSAV